MFQTSGGAAPAWAPDSGLIDTAVLPNGRRKVFNMLRWANQSDLSAFAADSTSPRGYPYEHDLRLIDCTEQWWASHNGVTFGTTFPESSGPYLNDSWLTAPQCEFDLTAGVYAPTQLQAGTDYSTVIYTAAGATSSSAFELRAEKLKNSCTAANNPGCVGTVESEIQRHALIPRGETCRVPSLHEWDTDQTVPPCSGTSIETTCLSGYATQVQRDNPRLHLCLGEASGALANDETVNNLHGTYVNGPSLGAAGVPGAGSNTAVSFNGTNQYLEIPDPTDPTAYTLEVWVKLNSTANQSIIARTPAGGPFNGASHQLRISGGKFQHYLYDGSQRFVTGTTAVQTGVWYHVVGVATNNGSMTLYVNGQQEGTPTTLGILWTGGDRWYVASNSARPDNYLNGTLDEIAIYPHVLSSSRILFHYQSGSGDAKPRCASDYADEVAIDAPHAHLCLGENSGDIAYNNPSTEWHGSYRNSPSLSQTGIPGGGLNTAVSFNGVDEYIELVDATDPAQYTLEAWVKLDSTANQVIIQRTVAGGPSQGHSHELRVAGGAFQHYVYDGNQRFVSGVTPVQTGVWYHVAGVATSNGLMKLYVNGQQDGERSTIGSLWMGGDRWYIGAADAMGAGYVSGRLDEVAIYATALAPSVIARHYAIGAATSDTRCHSDYFDRVSEDQPRAHFCLGEASGRVANDETPNELDGFYRNGPSLMQPGIPGGGSNFSVTFDGVNDYLEVPDADDPTAYTIETWVKLNSTANQSIITRTSASGPSYDASHQLRVSGGKFQHYVYDGTQHYISGTTSVETGVWYHVAGVATNNGAMKLYVNGQEEGTTRIIGALWTGGDRWFIASNSSQPDNYLSGTLDELSIYSVPLSSSTLVDHFTEGSRARIEFDAADQEAALGADVSVGFSLRNGLGQAVSTDWQATVQGANGPRMFEGQTTAQGRATFSYAGSTAGADIVTVTALGLAETSDVWVTSPFGEGSDTSSETAGPGLCGTPCAPDEASYLLLEDAPLPGCPDPGTYCIYMDRSTWVDGGENDALNGRPYGRIRQGGSFVEWDYHSRVDFAKCKNEQNNCRDYSYPCGGSTCVNPGWWMKVSDPEQRIQRNRIFPGAVKICGRAGCSTDNDNRKADVGIELEFVTQPGQWYRMVVTASLAHVKDKTPRDVDTGFKARLTVSSRDADEQIGECNAVWGISGGSFSKEQSTDRHTPGLVTQMPYNEYAQENLRSVVVAFRAHISDARLGQTDEKTSSGEARLFRISFRRIPVPSGYVKRDPAKGSCRADKDYRPHTD